MKRKILLLGFLSILGIIPWLFADESAKAPVNAAPRKANPFASQFFLSPLQSIQQQSYLIDGFAFLETPDRERNSRYSLVTDFGKTMVRSQVIPNVQSVPDIKKWLKESVETSEYEGVEIRKLKVPLADSKTRVLYWVGQKGFSDLEKAKQEIEQLKAVVAAEGGDLTQVVREAKEMFQAPEEEKKLEIQQQANFQKEEALAVQILEKMDFGDKLFGPFQGEASGEPIIWRSFGETSWRKTVFESDTYSSAVGYWTNQLVFEGLKFPLSSINPYIEVTTAMDSSPVDYKSNILAYLGAEWRPLARNPWLVNFRPYGIPLLQWIRNYRVFMQYGNRWNIKDEILNSRNYDFQVGFSNYYEFGVDLPPIDQGAPSTVPEYLQEYVWGEYYGNYFYSRTGFSSEEDWDAWTLNSSVTLGFKTPAIHLPDNVFFDQIVLMPYLRFEHVNNDMFSFPYANRSFLAAGVRWMPFRTYRHKNNEWLAKIKVFGEYMGVGGVQYWKDDPVNSTDNDLTFGVKFSSNRY